MIRIGYSEDVHKFEKGKKLFLGGVYIPDEDGLKAHSDGDVVLHAVGESILGALALGDLGKFFPDNDSKFKDISSQIIVNKIVEMMEQRNFEIGNIDIEISADRPYLSNFKEKMREKIASLLKTNLGNVSVKAMSNNGVGETGKGLAIKATSVVLLVEKSSIN